MKFNKWTLGLAAVGAVSMASAVRADETKLSTLNTAVSSTVISGYVDVAAQYNAGSPSGKDSTYVPNMPIGLRSSKVDNFTLNNVTISLDKALDETPWASGYHIDLNAGTDQIDGMFGDQSTTSHAAVRQAYVTMRTPVGNGIDWKMGVIDGVTGYESNTDYLNPNYTRSYGYLVNPASFTGLIGSYKICNAVTVQAGIANRGNNFSGNGLIGAQQRSVGLSSKDYIATVAFTAPDSWGFLKGSVLNLGTFQGLDNGAVNNYSANATLNTPVTGLKVGLSFDTVQTLTGPNSSTGAQNLSWDGNIFGVYATYQATDKLGFNLRGEYVDASGAVYGAPNFQEVTATVQYDLWANVVSRIEFRWDHIEHGQAFNNGGGYSYNGDTSGYFASTENAFMVALNLIYKF